MSHQNESQSYRPRRDGIPANLRKTIMKSTILTSPLTTAQLAEMIGRTEQQMICEGFDLDLFDTARWLIGNKVDLDNRDDVAVAPRTNSRTARLSRCGGHPRKKLHADVIAMITRQRHHGCR
jgi:hypothetical protein